MQVGRSVDQEPVAVSRRREYDDEDDMDDFIVDDDGQPITDKRKKRKPIFKDAALQEAQDIFGVDFDYEDLEREEEEERAQS